MSGAGTDPATGVTTPHGDTVVPLHDGPAIDALAAVTPVVPNLPDNRFSPAAQGTVFDTAADQRDRYAAIEADARAAQASGQDARDSMLGHYQVQALPLGGQLGDDLVLPVVPDNAVIAASSDQYPWPGDEPLPSSAGPSYQGNVPMNSS